MRTKTHLIVPLIILTCLATYTVFPYFGHETLAAQTVPMEVTSDQTIRWLGTALVGALIYIFNTIVRSIRELSEDLKSINNNGCAAYQQHTAKIKKTKKEKS